MSYEGTYESLLGGVSEQVFFSRQPNQCSAQVNMLCDLVTGLRRRPGSRKYKYSVPTFSVDATKDEIAQYQTDIGEGTVCVLVNTRTGVTLIVPEDSSMAVLPAQSYLQTNDPTNIRFTTVDGTVFVANKEKKPVADAAGTPPANPDKAGYFYPIAGAFSKTYRVTVETNNTAYTAEYTTPKGTTAGDSDKATPEYIAARLQDTLVANLATAGLAAVTREGPYVYVQAMANKTYVTVTTTSGTTYMLASNRNETSQESYLPAKLPSVADRFIMRVGTNKFYTYYRYDHSRSRWVENGAYGSAVSLSNMPLALSYSSRWAYQTVTWPGRLAGDDTTNPNPEFLEYGITGIGAYQGRLCILAGPYVTFSSSKSPYNFYRETVSQVLASDTISIASSGAGGADFEYAVPYNADLLVMARKYQAVVPGRATAITPSNATIVLSTSYDMSHTVSPVATGRSLFFVAPTSSSTFSMMEMLPSQYTESQYEALQVTSHIPEYLQGTARFMAESTTNPILVVAPSGERNRLVIHEYLWTSEGKQQSAWHKWEFPLPVLACWFVRETMLVLTANYSTVTSKYQPFICTINLREGAGSVGVGRYVLPADFVSQRPVTDWDTDAPYITFPDPVQYNLLKGLGIDNVLASVSEGQYFGSPLEIKTWDDANSRIYLWAVYDNSKAYLGVKFQSTFIPSPPRVYDRNGAYLGSNKITLVHYSALVSYSTEFKVNIQDRGGLVAEDFTGLGISWESRELSLEARPVSGTFKVVIPCRVETETSKVTFTSDGVRDMNLQQMDYTLRINRRVRRL